MNALPASDVSLLVRTDFSDDAAWKTACEAASQCPSEIGGFMELLSALNGPPAEGFSGPSSCTPVDDVSYADADPDELWKAAAATNGWPVLFIFDQVSAAHPEQAILVINLRDGSGRRFRATPDQLHWIESNLSIANCDWEDFAEALDDDGVHRGFPEA